MKTAAKILLGILSVLYPLLWYYGREQDWFYPLAGFMLLLWLARAAMQRDPGQRRVSLLVAAFFAAILLFRRPDSMYWYPVWVNGLLLLLFGLSLTQKQSLIERLARLQHPGLPPEGVAYTRRVTQIWCGFFILNGATAAILAGLQYYDWWAAYTGIVSYVLMGLLFAGEWVYRKAVLKV